MEYLTREQRNQYISHIPPSYRRDVFYFLAYYARRKKEKTPAYQRGLKYLIKENKVSFNVVGFKDTPYFIDDKNLRAVYKDLAVGPCPLCEGWGCHRCYFSGQRFIY